MRCPKCHYISFDSGERCRNCGYEFSLSLDVGSLDLPIQTGDEPEGPLADFSLEELDHPPPSPNAASAAPPPLPDPVPPRPITSSFDLPLFRDRASDDDRPLVSAPAVPRPPLSVRKTAPVPPRPGARRDPADEPRLDLAEPGEAPRSRPAASAAAPGSFRGVAEPHGARPSASTPSGTMAPAGARLLAACLDFVLLGAIDLGILHLTLKLCGLEYSEIGVLPAAPLVTFFLLLNGGYITAFTAAGGQSIGKMATGIKVVPSDPDAWSDRVPLGQAVLRAVAYLLSALPLGLGFLAGLIGADKRAFHDRLAHTRVVKA